MEKEIARAIATSESFVKHARKCKKALDDCDTCKSSVAFHASLSLPLLSTVLEDRPKNHARITLSAS